MLGGGLEKIFLLIGDERERKFLSKNLDQIPGHKSPDSLEKKKVWQNLVKFLKNELALREKFTLLQKVDYLGINSARNVCCRSRTRRCRRPRSSARSPRCAS